MKVDLRSFKIEKAASKDETKPVLNGIYLDQANGVIVATDGYGMAVVPVDLGLDDANGLIPAEALAIARKDQGKSGQADVSVNGTIGVSLRGKRVEFDRADFDSFPDWTKFFASKGKPTATFAINAGVLARIAEAVGGQNGVKIELYGPTDAIMVTPLGEPGLLGAKGLAMPIRLSV